MAYVSIMTDTNSFRYSRTTPLSHRIAAAMIELGVNPEEVYQAIYSSKEVSHLQLLGHTLQNVKVASSGKLAWIELGLDLRKKHQASVDDTQSFLNLLLLLKDAEVVCLFREEEDGQIRVSIKSKGRIVVNKIAAELGGGGHEYAAGVAFTSPRSTRRSMPSCGGWILRSKLSPIWQMTPRSFSGGTASNPSASQFKVTRYPRKKTVGVLIY